MSSQRILDKIILFSNTAYYKLSYTAFLYGRYPTLFFYDNNFFLYKLYFKFYYIVYGFKPNFNQKTFDSSENDKRLSFTFQTFFIFEYIIVEVQKLRLFFFKYIYVYLYNFMHIVKWLWLSFILVIFYFIASLYYIQIDVSKQIVVWYLLLIVYYLLISGFNSFLNKYRYGKFTSAIQRFWKRTGMIFWLIEGFLFLLFFYYFLNSSQEPLYMFDYSNLNQEFLIQLKVSYKNLLLLSISIWLCFILLINLNFFLYTQIILILSIITLFITYTLFLESYQFVYIISLYADKEWVFEEIDNIWLLEIEQNNLRVKQQYFVLCLIAKYWHFIFIFISWFFFIIKSLESGFVSITMMGYNTQNLLILYLLNLLCLIQWLKVLTKKFLEITYSWFFTQYDEKFFVTLIYEIWLTLTYFFNFNLNSTLLNSATFIYKSFSVSETFLWKV